MILFAHAGHWLVQLIYLVPLAVLVGVIVAGRIRDRREAANEEVREGDGGFSGAPDEVPAAMPAPRDRDAS
jgi:hypothetical protein